MQSSENKTINIVQNNRFKNAATNIMNSPTFLQSINVDKSQDIRTFMKLLDKNMEAIYNIFTKD